MQSIHGYKKRMSYLKPSDNFINTIISNHDKENSETNKFTEIQSPTHDGLITVRKSVDANKRNSLQKKIKKNEDLIKQRRLSRSLNFLKPIETRFTKFGDKKSALVENLLMLDIIDQKSLIDQSLNLNSNSRLNSKKHSNNQITKDIGRKLIEEASLIIRMNERNRISNKLKSNSIMNKSSGEITFMSYYKEALAKKNNLDSKKVYFISNESFERLKRMKTLKYQESDIENLSFHDITEENKHCLIIHYKPFRIFWDCLIFFLSFYSVVFIPILLSLENLTIYLRVEILVESIYLVDIIFNFITTYKDKEDNTITNSKIILINYLTGWFFLDTAYSFPLVIIENFYKISRSGFYQWMKILRILRLMKKNVIGRVFKDLIIFRNHSINRILKFVFLFLIIIHIISTFFIFLGKSVHSENNWIRNSGFDSYDYSSLYISSFYFIIVTIYTVGYGDIVAVNIKEKIFLIIFLFVGNLLYSYVISSFSNIFSETNANFRRYKENVNTLNSIKEEYDISDNLYNQAKLVISSDFKKNKTNKYILTESLPSNLKNRLFQFMYKEQINQHKFFFNQTNDFVLYVLPLLKTHRVTRNEKIASIGQFLEEMYLIDKGSLALNLGNEFCNLEIGSILENNYFGDLFLQTNQQCLYDLRCKTKSCSLFILKKSDYLKIKNLFSDSFLKILGVSLRFLNILAKRRTVFIRLYNVYKSPEIIRRKIIELDLFFLEKGLSNIFEYELDIEKAINFIIEGSYDNLLPLLEGDEYYRNSKKGLNKVISRLTLQNNTINEDVDKIKIENTHKEMERIKPSPQFGKMGRRTLMKSEDAFKKFEVNLRKKSELSIKSPHSLEFETVRHLSHEETVKMTNKTRKNTSILPNTVITKLNCDIVHKEKFNQGIARINKFFDDKNTDNIMRIEKEINERTRRILKSQSPEKSYKSRLRSDKFQANRFENLILTRHANFSINGLPSNKNKTDLNIQQIVDKIMKELDKNSKLKNILDEKEKKKLFLKIRENLMKMNLNLHRGSKTQVFDNQNIINFNFSNNKNINIIGNEFLKRDQTMNNQIQFQSSYEIDTDLELMNSRLDSIEEKIKNIATKSKFSPFII